MRGILVILAAALNFALAASTAHANDVATAPIADQTQTAQTQTAQAQDAAPKKGFWALLQGDPAVKAERAALRAERKAQRLAAREARKAARAARLSGKGAGEVASRADVKNGVEFALDNKPSGRWWCVPFARLVSGLDLRGNAKTWWAQAKGRYDRGQEPKVGAVMAFAASRAMPKGHVAVVSDVVSDREILVVQANWVRGKVTLDDRVVDVSEKGDWSVVRVENHAETLGRANPVNGFIYNG